MPGCFELPVVAKSMAKSGAFDAIICIGVVVRGATTHYEAVCNAAVSGCLSASSDTGACPSCCECGYLLLLELLSCCECVYLLLQLVVGSPIAWSCCERVCLLLASNASNATAACHGDLHSSCSQVLNCWPDSPLGHD